MNAVDARGLCHNCGWQVGATQAYDSYLADDESPSLGQTRIAAAPIVPGAPPTAGTRVVTPPPTQPTQASRATGRPGDAPAYCGTCGARLEDGQAFCGQCGSPVTGVGADDALGSRIGAGLTVAAPVGPAPASGPARYRIGDAQGWADDDARTEMFTEAPQRAPYGPYGSGGGTRGRVATPPPYGSRGYTSGYAGAGQAVDSSTRTLKIVFGLLCLLGGLITAIAAIVLALSTFK